MGVSEESALRILNRFSRSPIHGGSNIYIAGVLHVVPDILPFIGALQSVGIPAERIHLTGPPYSWDEDTAESLARMGVRLVIPEEGDILSAMNGAGRRILRDVIGASEESEGRFVIIEDGGYLVPLAHREFAGFATYCIGAVEQTTNGILRDHDVDEDTGLQIPVISIPSCQIKRLVEPVFIGDAAVRNLQLVMNELGLVLQTSKVGIVGYGSIGRAVSLNLLERRITPVVRDIGFVKQLQARVEGCDTAWSTKELMTDCDVVIGATGTTGDPPIGRTELAASRDGLVLASVTSKQVEFDLDALREIGQLANQRDFWSEFKMPTGSRVYLLFDGQPINFQLTFSLPARVVDTIYSLMLDSVRVLTARSLPIGINDCVANEEEIAKNYFEEYEALPGPEE